MSKYKNPFFIEKWRILCYSNGMKKILIINGPNLNMLGKRQVDIYGRETLDEIITQCQTQAKQYNMAVEGFQDNVEGNIVTRINQAFGQQYHGVVINGGAYTHTSVAIRDALAMLTCPIIEVHLSNIHAREEFRHFSYISAIARAVVVGMGSFGYISAIHYLGQLQDKP